MSTVPAIICRVCGRDAVRWLEAQSRWSCAGCGEHYAGTSPVYLDLAPASQQQTSDHYSLQWGNELGFLQFIQDHERAKTVMPAARLGWDKLFSEIRDACGHRSVSVYDAACGFGGLTNEVVNEQTAGTLTYVGADVHGSLTAIVDRVPALNRCGLLLRWDISQPLPVAATFDYVLCRAAIHHTPDPATTFKALCARLKPRGTIAISAYRKKSVAREAVDDALRREIGALSPADAFEACRQFTVLGQALQQVTQSVEIPVRLPLLGVEAGTYSVQSLIYYHLLKCFYNPTFGDRYSTLVNYDWYHPEHAFRYDIEELRGWFHDNNLELTEETSIDVQHYLSGRRRE